MNDYTELKRLAEAATPGPWKVKDRKVVTTEDAAICCSPVFRIGAYKQSMANTEYFAAASPDVVLGLIKSLEHAQMAAEAEAKEVDERNAVIDKLRTQNQALREALKDAARSLETVSKLAGRATYGNPPIETFMQHHDEVRGYAASRAGVAFESLAQAEGGV